MMAYHTGMRRGEILGLTWDRVDLQRRMIYLEAKHPKDKEPRNVPMSAELFKMLQEMPGKVAESGKTRHVFQHKGEPCKATSAASGRPASCRHRVRQEQA
jgi:integrase